jgi:hypothetical protein
MLAPGSAGRIRIERPAQRDLAAAAGHSTELLPRRRADGTQEIGKRGDSGCPGIRPRKTDGEVEARHRLPRRGYRPELLKQTTSCLRAVRGRRQREDCVAEIKAGARDQPGHGHLPLPPINSPVRVSNDRWSDRDGDARTRHNRDYALA